MRIVRIEDLKAFPEMRELTPDEMKEAMQLARESFTAADLAAFFEIDNDRVNMDEFIVQMEKEFAGTNAGAAA